MRTDTRWAWHKNPPVGDADSAARHTAPSPRGPVSSARRLLALAQDLVEGDRAGHGRVERAELAQIPWSELVPLLAAAVAEVTE